MPMTRQIFLLHCSMICNHSRSSKRPRFRCRQDVSRKLQLIQLQIPTGLFDRLAKKDAGRWKGKEDDAAGSRHPHGVESAQCSPRPLLLRTRSQMSRQTTIAQIRASLMRMRIWVMRESPLCQFRSHGQRDPQDGKEGQEVRRQLMQLYFHMIVRFRSCRRNP